MKTLFTAGLLACTLALAGCATSEAPASSGDARETELAQDFANGGIMKTGSRIPHKASKPSP